MSQHRIAERSSVKPGGLPATSSTVETAHDGGSTSLHANLRRMVLLAIIYAFPACLAIASLAFGQNNPDLWWHLRTGAWIVQHHNVPWTDPYSTFGMGKPWFAYSWLYELVLYGFYRWLGLIGPAVCVVLLATGNGVALYGAVRKRMGGLAAPIALTGVGMLILLRFYSAMPVFVSILCFVVEMDILFAELVGEPHQSSLHRLWLLPALFAVWANIHVEFLYGLAVLVVAALMQNLTLVHGPEGTRIVASSSQIRHRLWLVTGASILATLVNPYTWRIYWVILELALDREPFKFVSELNAPDFRSPLDYILIFAVLAAAFVLGRVRFRGNLFAGVLLVGCTIVSLRAAHDEWVVLIVALLIIAVGCRLSSGPEVLIARPQQIFAGLLAVVLVLAWAKRSDFSNAHLEAAASRDFPVKAADFVLQQGLRGPLFNGFNWGGYLIWRLPNLPVSMDGRTNVYGGARAERSIRTWNCMPGWKTDPDLNAANLIIGSTKAPLSYGLQDDQRYQVVYRDAIAIVYVKRPR